MDTGDALIDNHQYAGLNGKGKFGSEKNKPGPYPFWQQTQPSGRSADFHQNLVASGMYDEYLIGSGITKPQMYDILQNKLKWNYGDVVQYYSTPAVTGTLMHGQFWTGDIYQSNPINGRGWSTDKKNNWDTSFVYRKYGNSYTYTLYVMKIKPAYLV